MVSMTHDLGPINKGNGGAAQRDGEPRLVLKVWRMGIVASLGAGRERKKRGRN